MTLAIGSGYTVCLLLGMLLVLYTIQRTWQQFKTIISWETISFPGKKAKMNTRLRVSSGNPALPADQKRIAPTILAEFEKAGTTVINNIIIT